MSQLSDRPLDDEELSEFTSYGRKGLSLLGSAPETDDPIKLVTAVNEYVDSWQKKKRSFLGRLRPTSTSETIEPSLALGIVWGNQIVRRFGWEWRCVLTGGDGRYGVISPDRSLAIYATYFIKECLDAANADCTVLLSFNMLGADSFSRFPIGGYLSVMGSVRRIVERSFE